MLWHDLHTTVVITSRLIYIFFIIETSDNLLGGALCLGNNQIRGKKAKFPEGVFRKGCNFTDDSRAYYHPFVDI